MSQIFRYPGGKSKKQIREQIIAKFPKKYSEYRDVMVGGGGIFFHVPITKKRWINDVACLFLNWWTVVKNNRMFIDAVCYWLVG